MYTGIIEKITKIEKHPNADKLLIAEVAGENVIISIDMNMSVGDIGLYFPSGGALSHEFIVQNNLYRKNPDTGQPLGGYMESNRRVRAQKIRGVISNGIFVNLSALAYTGVNLSSLDVGQQISVINGCEICEKFFNSPQQKNNNLRPRNFTFWDKILRRNKRRKSPSYPYFYEIGNTPRFFYNIHQIDIGDEIIITEKLHGTSGRTGLFLVEKNNTLKEKLLSWIGIKKYGHVPISGTRRTILNEYSSHIKEKYRSRAAQKVFTLLIPGRIVYYEIVGYDDNGKSIMPEHNATNYKNLHQYCNYNLDEKEQNKYGIVYNYGCSEDNKESQIYVYKIIDHDENMNPVILGWDEVIKLCNMANINAVPFVDRLKITSEEDKQRVLAYVKFLSDGVSVLSSHLKEGVCVTVCKPNGHMVTYKHKGASFCLLEDIAPYDPEDMI
jgi:hypothetical protein